MAFINNDDNQDQNNQQAQPAAPSTSAPATGGQAAPAQTPNAPKGSGRFTNIQKYIGANQGAGERLATGVGKKVESKVGAETQKTQDSLSGVRAGIQAGQNQLQTGQQLQNNVNDQNWDLQNFAADQNNVNQFNQYRTGQAVDEAALNTQAQTAQQAAAQSLKNVQDVGNQFGTEGGRQQLLKQTFSPGRNYSVGQQRLDQLFLSQATPQMQQIQGNLSNSAKNLQGLNTQLTDESGNIKSLAEQEAAIAQGLQTGITGRETSLVDQVNSTQGAVNAQRAAEQEAARTGFSNLVDGKAVNQNFANLTGLKSDDRLLNVLKKNANVDDYLKFNDTMLQGPDQLAQQQDRMKYDAIAKLAGIDPTQRRINMDTQVAGAVDNTGKLRSSLDTAKTNFDKYLADNSATGSFSSTPNFYGNNVKANSSTNLAGLTGAVDQLDALGGTNALKFSTQQPDSGLKFYNQNNDALNNLVNPLNSSLDLNTKQSNPFSQFGSTFADGIGDERSRTIAGDKSTGDQAQQTAKARALMDAYRQMAEQGYLQKVNIGEDT